MRCNICQQISFNPDNRAGTWQYAAAPIVAEEAYSSVTVTVTYDYNVNEIRFDGIQLFKEVFGNSYTYDENGNVISSENLQKQTTTYEYDSNNNLVKVILSNEAEMTYTYDAYDNVKTATTAEGLVYNFEYDHYGNNTRVSTTVGGKTISSTAVYTTDGNYMVSSTDALGNRVQYGYNTDTGILEWEQGPWDTEATRTAYTYDPQTFLLESEEAVTDTGLEMFVNYTYDSEGLLTKLQTPTTAYEFTYGDFNLQHNVKIGSRELAKYTYDEKNYSLKKLDYGNGDYVQYEYDDYGRLLLETYEDEETVFYQYDNDGVLVAVTDSASGITTRQYFDLSGRSVGYSETANNFTHSVGYAYDEINNLIQLVEDIDGVERTTSYTYDDDNRTTSVTTDGITVEYTYDSFGRVTQQVTKLKGETAEQDQVILTEYFTFTEPSAAATSGQVATYRTVSAGLDITYSYTYDANGNILTVSDGTNVTGYTYDTANQLVREDNQQEGKTYTWTYDAAGNITAYKTYAYSPDVADLSEVQPTSAVPYVYSTAEWKDLLVSYNGKTIEYDTNGNPDHIGDRTFTWQHGRQLATLTENNTTWNYTYNNAGLRTGRYVVNGASYKYVYNGSQLVQMTKDNQTVNFTYDANGSPLAMKIGNNTYYYVTNLQGDIVALVNNAGTTVVSYSYSAFGEVTVTDHDGNDNADINPLTYRGYVYDAETKLFYLQSRYYDPEIGRFINADAYATTGQGFTGNNMFTYCGNNPVNRVDPTGQCWHFWLGWLTLGLVDCNACKEAKASEVLVISTNEWMESSTQMGNDLADAIGTDSVNTVGVSNDSFSDTLSNTTANYVVVHTHGSKTSLTDNKGFKVTTEDVGRLTRNNNIEYMIVTACSTGGSVSEGYNMGQMLSTKISESGYVICSTTDVVGTTTNFWPKGDGQWVVYQNGQLVDSSIAHEITMKYIAKYIKEQFQ